jgi:signal transduction histidine kinase/ligand-binding sensor domain-containing protein
VQDTQRRMGIWGHWRHGGGLLGLWLLAALGVGTPGLALEPGRRLSQYNDHVWRSEDGLPQNTVFAIEQTSEGFLWFGTHEGLVRFDGARFTVFDRRTSPEMRSHAVVALVEDAAGVLWVGTHQGVLRYEGGQLRRMPEEGALAEVPILELAADSRSVWIGSRLGLMRIPVSGGAPSRYFGARDGLPGGVGVIAPDGAGGAWVSTARGVARVSGNSVEVIPLPAGEGPVVSSLLLARDGTLWIGTVSGLLSLREGRFTPHGPEVGGPRATVQALLEDRDGNLWIATEQGLLRRNEAGFSAFTTPRALASGLVYSLREDSHGHLWVGTSMDGVHRLSSGPFLPFGAPEGSTLESTSIALETYDGALWVGSIRGGLERIKDGLVTRLGPAQGLEDTLMRALMEGPDGALWAGTRSGAFRFDGQRFVRVWPEPGRPPVPVHSMLAEPGGGVWLASLAGLVWLHEGRATVYGREHGFVPEAVMPMVRDDAGVIWYGTHAGLVRFSQGSFTRLATQEGLAEDWVMSLYADPRGGGLWIGTTAGLVRMKEGRFVRLTSAHGLPDDTAYTLLLDSEDHFWMSSNKGIARVSRRELEEVVDGRRQRVRASFFDDRDGMRASECNGGPQPAGWRARDGKMGFVTLHGPVRVDPKDARLQHPPPRPYIEELRVQGRHVPLTGRLELEPGQQELELRFTAFTAHGAERLAFRYRLEGYDKGWVDAEDRRVASYSRLPPGTYRFQVSVQGRSGEWVEPGAVLEVTLRPWFYQTAWFYVLCVVGAGGVVASVYAWRVGRLKARERWLHARVEERTRELAQANEALDANLRELRATQAQLVQAGKMAAVGTLAAGVGHEINNPLTYIISNLEHVSEEAAALAAQEEGSEQSRERLREMQQVLREALMGADRVRRIVRDLKTFSRQDEDTCGPVDLRGVLDSAAKMAGGELRPRAQLVRDYAAEVPLVEGSEARLSQVFLNLIINAAQALPEGRPEQNEVRLVLRRGDEGQVVAEVRDTGSGIPPEVLGRIFDPFFTTKPVGVGTGLGLALSQTFITSMKGRIEVESQPGSGTVFRVRLPAAAPHHQNGFTSTL